LLIDEKLGRQIPFVKDFASRVVGLLIDAKHADWWILLETRWSTRTDAGFRLSIAVKEKCFASRE